MLNSLTQSQPTITVGLVVFFLLFTIAQIVISIDTPENEARCLNCIRNVSSSLGVDVTKRCEGYYCGPYQLSYTYWAEAGKPGNNQGLRDYEKCARNKNCAEQTVRAYFKKFKRDCNKDGLIDCQDMAALHKGGPTSCASDWFYKSRYWLAFNKTSCMTGGDQSESSGESASGGKQNKNFMNLENSHNLKHPDGLVKNQSLTTECLDCICEAVTGCNTSANNCGSGTVCGPFAISQAYWKDGRKPGASWTACARTKECSIVIVKNYMEKYKKDCNDDGYITCEDYAAIHRRGPKTCSNRDLLKDNYWNKFLACRANQKPAKDVNMVKVSDSLAHANVLASRGDINLLMSASNRNSSSTTSTITTTTATTLQPTQAQSNTINQLASTSTHLTSSPPTDFSNMRRGVIASPSSSTAGATTGANSAPISSSSSLPAQTTIAASESTKFDYVQTPTYELTSMVLNIKDDNQSKDANSDSDPSLEASTIRNHHLQQPQLQQQQHDRERYGNVASNADDDQHGIAATQIDRLGPHLSSSTKLESEPSIDYPTLSSPVHELSAPSRGTDRELLMSLPPESSQVVDGSTSSQTPTATSDAASSSVPIETTAYQSTATTASTYMSSSPSSSSIATTRQHDRADDQTSHENSNHQQLEPSQASNIAEQQPSRELQLVPNGRLPILAMPAMSPGDEMIDYSVPDFSFPSQVSTVDRVNNFDRVVTGIVGSPDFSRSYPPVPDIISSVVKQASEHQQRQSTSDEQEQQSLVTRTNHQLTVTTNHSRNPNNQQQHASKHPQLQIVESPQRIYTRIAPIVNQIPSSSEHNNQQQQAHSYQLQQETMMTPNKNVNNSKQQHQLQQPTLGNGLLTKPLPSIFNGGESLNMSSLFENGSLNESSRIASECLECICDASSNCDTTVQCISKQREKNRCGLYMISWNQYQESDISLTSVIPTIGSSGGASGSSSEELADEKMYYECTTDRSCAEKLIYLYIEKHQKDCNNDGKIDCFDIAAIHRVGPENCNSSKFLASQYWKDFNICYATDRITTTTATTTTTVSSSPVQPYSSSSSSTLPHLIGLYS